jgi:hypothetical protein
MATTPRAGSQKQLGIFLSILRIIETVYLLTFLFIIYARYLIVSGSVSLDELAVVVEVWITGSLMALPLLLFKNVLEAILNNGILKRHQNEAVFMLVRCAFYVLLAIYSFQVITALP